MDGRRASTNERALGTSSAKVWSYTMPSITRREFTKAAAFASVTAAAGVATAQPTTKPTTTTQATDRIRLGFIGVGNRGDQVLSAFLAHADADVVATCDLHQPY